MSHQRKEYVAMDIGRICIYALCAGCGRLSPKPSHTSSDGEIEIAAHTHEAVCSEDRGPRAISASHGTHVRAFNSERCRKAQDRDRGKQMVQMQRWHDSAYLPGGRVAVYLARVPRRAKRFFLARVSATDQHVPSGQCIKI